MHEKQSDSVYLLSVKMVTFHVSFYHALSTPADILMEIPKATVIW